MIRKAVPRKKHKAARSAKPTVIFAAAAVAFMICVALAYGVAAYNRRVSNLNALSHAVTVNRLSVALPLQSGQQPRGLTVNRAQLDRHVVRALNALGDRFERPGQERSILIGTFTRYTGADKGTTQVQITREFPDKLRFEEQTPSGLRVFRFDGQRPWVGSGSGTPTDEEARFIEALVRDTVEHFIAGQLASDATRVLGDQYRLDDGSASNYQGPYYDILKVVDTFTSANQTDRRPAFYYLNSQTGLPEKIVYEQQAGAVRVEEEFSDWVTVLGQQIPRGIVRKENGVPVLQLVVNQAAFGPARADGIFNGPGGR